MSILIPSNQIWHLSFAERFEKKTAYSTDMNALRRTPEWLFFFFFWKIAFSHESKLHTISHIFNVARMEGEKKTKAFL